MTIQEMCRELGILIEPDDGTGPSIAYCFFDKSRGRFVIRISDKIADSEREAFLAHEFAHIVRGDIAAMSVLSKRFQPKIINEAADIMIHNANPHIVPILDAAAARIIGNGACSITWERARVPKGVCEVGLVPVCEALVKNHAMQPNLQFGPMDGNDVQGVDPEDLQKAIEELENISARASVAGQDLKDALEKIMPKNGNDNGGGVSRDLSSTIRKCEAEMRYQRYVAKIVREVEKLSGFDFRSRDRIRSWAHLSRRANVPARVFDRRPRAVVAVDLSGSMGELVKYATGIAAALENKFAVDRIVFASTAARVKTFRNVNVDVGGGTNPETIFEVTSSPDVMVLVSDFIFYSPFCVKCPTVCVVFGNERDAERLIVAPKKKLIHIKEA